MRLVYDHKPVDPIVEIERVIELFQAIKDEAWAKSLHLDQLLAMLENLPPQAWEMGKGQSWCCSPPTR